MPKSFFLFLVCLTLIVNAPIYAVDTQIWEVSDYNDLLKGEAEMVSILEPGSITLGPKIDAFCKTEDLYVWCAVADGDGGVYLGTGDEGKVYHVNNKGEISEIADLEAPHVYALTADGKNGVYAGVAPDGDIYHITKKGEVTPYFETEEKYIWSLLKDGKVLYAGTGPEGKLYKIEGKGKGKVLFDSSENHIMSLAIRPDRSIIAGSEGEGLIYSVDSKSGKAFVMYDSDQTEIRALVVAGDGTVYAAANKGGFPGGGLIGLTAPQMESAAPEGAGDEEQAAVTVSMSSSEMMSGPVGDMQQSAIYEIKNSGTVRLVWQNKKGVVYALNYMDSKTLLAGTGTKGSVYLVNIADGREALVSQVRPDQILSIADASGDGIFLTTANPGDVYHLKPGFAEEGTFISEVYDSSAISQWGAVDFEVASDTGKIEISTRSGNVKEPDNTWSDWSAGISKVGEKTGSPASRFIQWRAVLKSEKEKAPTLNRVSLAYMQENLAPLIGDLGIDTNGSTVKKNGGSKASNGRSAPPIPTGGNSGKSEVRKVTWKGTDPNGDKLEYLLEYRGKGEKNWKELEKELTDTQYSWDTTAVPDGYYFLKVTASDSPANSAGLELSASCESEMILIDNTAPILKSVESEASRDDSVKVKAVVADGLSPVSAASYSLDSGDWKPVPAADGIFDTLSETLEFSINKVEKGEHTIVIRMEDQSGNVGAGKTACTVK